jgi:hypothetical protein
MAPFIRFTLICLVFPLAAWAVSPQEESCELTMSRPGRLGIGVLTINEDGERDLGISPYAGSLHYHIVDRLVAAGANKGLWLGEMRYEKSGDKIQIFEANETSGYYETASKGGLPLLIPMVNSVENLPTSSRALNFKGYAFRPEKLRLENELERLGDVRHSMNNTLSVISAPAYLLFSKRSTEETKKEIVEKFRETAMEHLILIRWILLNLIEDQRLDYASLSQILPFLAVFEGRLPITAIDSIDPVLLHQELNQVSRLLNPSRSEMRVDILRLAQ